MKTKLTDLTLEELMLWENFWAAQQSSAEYIAISDELERRFALIDLNS